MAITTTAKSPDAVDHLDIEAHCPNCGGTNAWRLLQALRLCDFCGSALWWPKDPDRPGVLVAEDAAASPDALLEVLRLLDAIRERSRLAGLRADLDRANGKPPIDRSDDPTLPDVSELKAERAHLFELEEHLKVLVPYVLISSTLSFHVLGRPRGNDLKAFRNLFFQLEEIAPAYAAPWNFRDRGLWVARQRLRPFTPEDLAVRPVARDDRAVQVEQLAARWRSQRMLVQPDLEPVSLESNLLEPNRWWVFRPFHYVRARTPMGHRWFLIDGQFANVAGYPDGDEVIRVTKRDWKPLDANEIRGASARAIEFRCPDCGQDVPLVERTDIQLCTNCGRLLVPSPKGLTTRPYAIVDRASLPWWPKAAAEGTAWLPFFRAEMSTDVAALIRGVLAVAGPAARLFPEAWPESWIPAFEALGVGRYDAWAFEWAEALTRTRPQRFERRFFLEEPVEKTNRVLPVTVHWDTVRPLLPRLLLELLPKPIQARLNPRVLKKVFESRIDVSKVSLVFVPAPVTMGSDRRVLGPASSVGWVPLRDGVWPPDLKRDVRRAMERGKSLDSERKEDGMFDTWIE